MRIIFILIFFFSNYSLFSQSAKNYKKLAIEKKNKGDIYGALADINKAIELDSEDAYSYYFRAGIGHEMGVYYKGAINDYTKALDLGLEASFVYSNRALSKRESKDYIGAVADYTKAIELSPNDGDLFYDRALVKGLMSDFNGACQDAFKANVLGSKASNLIKILCK